MAIILCLDLGTRTGYAVGDDESIPNYGSSSFPVGRFEGGGMRFVKFRKFLNTLYDAIQFEQIYFEEVRRHVSTDSAHVYGGLLATLTAWAEEHAMPHSGIPVGTIKKSATGKGNASKEMVMNAMKELGYVISNDDEADALAIFEHVRQNI